MVSKPTGFVYIHLVHASDADQAEAFLTRWGPDGLGKLGDPRWATPIKTRVREANQAHAINEVVNALKPEQHTANGEDIRPCTFVSNESIVLRGQHEYPPYSTSRRVDLPNVNVALLLQGFGRIMADSAVRTAPSAQ